MRQGVDILDKTWFWVASALDVAEGQLQRGEQFDTEVRLTLLTLLVYHLSSVKVEKSVVYLFVLEYQALS